MKIRTWATTAILAAALVAVPTTAIAAPVPASDAPPAASGECNFGQRVVAVWRQLPDELQADLKQLRELEPSARRDAAIEIRQKALDGGYGPEVQAKAETIKGRRLLALETMPIELKHDLLDLRNAAPGDRRELARQIADDALAGVYGPEAQQTVEKIRASDFWQECVAE
ncbi:MAG: hypothetical protein ACKVOG_05275 [Rhodoglobus sp.]